MQLNIKNAEAHRLATELASQTGESLTQAVTAALRDRLERIDRGRGLARRRADVEAIQAGVAAALRAAGRPTPRQTDFDAADYDDMGLPR